MTLESSRHVLVVAYQPCWKDEFDQIHEHIYRVVGHAVLRVDLLAGESPPPGRKVGVTNQA